MDEKVFTLVQNQEQLEAYIPRIKEAEYITVDTEFMRTNTYYPNICFLQICYKKNQAIVIDCLAEIDFTILNDIFSNANIEKIFHAAKQDIEALRTIKLTKVKPIFDTQIAAMGLGFSNNISYEKLIKLLLNQSLNKELKKSNWQIRPISEKHVEYAAYDVLYLYECYEKIKLQLESTNKIHWLKDSFAKLENINILNVNIDNHLKKVEDQTSQEYNAQVLKALIAWRENKASELNVLRHTVLSNDQIISILNNNKNIKNMLHKILTPTQAEKYIKEIEKTILTAKALLPEITNKISLTTNQMYILTLLKLSVKSIAEKNQVNHNLLTTKPDLIQLLLAKNINEAFLMQGWRKKVVGEPLIKLLNNQAYLSIENDKIILETKN